MSKRRRPASARPAGGRRKGKRNRRTTGRVLARRALRAGVLGRVVSWILGAGALAGAVMGLYYGWLCLRDTGRFQVSEVELRGAVRARWEELQAYTGIAVGDAILDLDLDAAALGVRRHPWVRAATVRRRLPDRITLELEEQQPAILVAIEELYIANAEGELFKRLEPQDGITGPVLTGLRREDTSLRPDRVAAVIRDGIAVVAAVEASELPSRLGRLEELHWDHDLGWSLVAGREGRPCTVHLGFDPVARIDVVLAALHRLESLGRAPNVIWADGTRVPTRAPTRVPTRVHVSFSKLANGSSEETLLATR
jgi:cell division protein FtsQ